MALADRALGTGLICLVTVFNYVDRSLLAILIEPIRREFVLTDAQLGALSGLAFGLTYAVLGVAVSRWADVGNRRAILGWSVLIWSIMTTACSWAQGFWQLFIARVGVGVGESSGAPTCHSLATDYFSPAEHGRAASYLASASMVGAVVGLAGGGWLAAAYGWRAALAVPGLCGVLLALCVLKWLPEPRAVTRAVSLGEIFGRQTVATVAGLLSERTFVLVLLGFAANSLFSMGLQQWGPSFMVRSFNLSLARAGLVYGVVVNGSLLLGALLGGPLADRARQRGVIWLVRVPALACLAAVPCYAVAFTSHSLWLFSLASLGGGLMLGLATPPIFACLYGVAGPTRRATAFAVNFLFFNLVGLGLGPVVIGALSDALRGLAGDESLRYSLLAVLGVLPITSVLFYACKSPE